MTDYSTIRFLGIFDRVNLLSLFAIFLIGSFSWNPTSGQEITHSFLACGQKTFIVDEKGEQTWSYPAATRDGFVLESGNIVLTLNKSKKYPGGAVIEIDGKTNQEKLIWKGTQSEVNSAHPVASGAFVLTEAGPNPRLIEVDREGKIITEFELACQKSNHHMQTRMARKLADGTFLAPHLLDFAVFHYDSEGKVLTKFDTTVPGDQKRKIHTWPFTAIRHNDGKTLVCCTHGNRVVEFNTEGKVVWQLTNEDLPGEWLQDPCGGQVLPNGNVVITSYAAGGKDPNAPKMIEVNRNKQVVWKYSNGRREGVHHFQILTTNGNKITGPPKK